MVNNQTGISLFPLVFIVLLGVLLLRVKRRYAMLPFIVSALYLTADIKIVVADLDFYMLRILFLIGWIKILSNSEARHIRLNTIDKLLIIQVAVFVITFTVLRGTTGAFINRLGQGLDVISMYFIPRFLIRDIGDMELLVKALFALSIPIFITMLIEKIYGFNMFSFIGGVPASSMVRNGQIRAQGPFSHPILAGNFGAPLLPLIVGLWWNNKVKMLPFIIGLVCALIIVISSNSSGPFIACIAGIIGILLWVVRNKMRMIFWGVIAGLAVLHIIMKAPVWALIMRFGSSGSSYHRFQIIDETIKHFGEWWMIGTRSTAHWGHLGTMEDVANFYCRIAIDSGMIGLILFLSIIIMCFKSVGVAIRLHENQPGSQKFIWAIGASLFVHTIAIIGVSYFGPSLFLFYIIVAISSSFRESSHGDEPDPYKIVSVA